MGCTMHVEPMTDKIRNGQGEEGIVAGTPAVQPNGGTDQLFQLTMLRALLLPPRCRDVFVLSQMHGYSLQEVSRVLGISKDDVKKHLRRAQRGMQNS
jgi:DNA-directed RNA polymerase specialized sigma24 family protein